MESGWLAGAAELDITPPLGLPLTGYGNRPGPASDIHDPLHARALVLAAGNCRVALLSLDLLGLDDDLVERIRRQVAAGVGIDTAALLVNCTHTHAGPATQSLRGLGRRDDAYCGLVCRWAASTVALAARNLRPARVSFGRAMAGIGRNRRERRPDGRIVLGDNPSGPYDPAVYALELAAEDGTPIGLWFSHATHPVILGSENTAVSADFPGRAAHAASAALDGAVALFAQGCCGDVNPARRGGFEEVRSVGNQLAGAALVAAGEARPLAATLAAQISTISLPLMRPASEAAARAELEAAASRLRDLEGELERGEVPAYRLQVPEAMVEWARDYLAAAQDPRSPAAKFTLQAIRLGDAAILATSGETFIAIGQAIQSASPFADTVALGYTNGCLGYVPTAGAFPEGGYEIETAYKYYGTLMLAPECERILLDAAAGMLNRLRPA